MKRVAVLLGAAVLGVLLAPVSPAAAATVDLDVTYVKKPPPDLVVGDVFEIRAITASEGVDPAPPTLTRAFLSVDDQYDDGDIALDADAEIPALAPGESVTTSRMAPIPGGTPTGRYYLIACADSLDVVVESNEVDNCAYALLRIQVTQTRVPDLLVKPVAITTSSAPAGGTLPVTDTTRNEGALEAPGTTTRYYLSTDLFWDPADRLLTGGRKVPPLAQEDSNTGTRVTTIPRNVPPGRWFVIACADDLDVVTEEFEDNNCRSSYLARLQVTPAVS